MNTKIGPYEIAGELGRGAMAVVWRGFDPNLEREVAIKQPILPSGLDADATSEFSIRFVREARAAARLNHPGIVTVYAADVFDGRPAIIMELVEGETLSDVLARGPLPADAVLAVLDQLLEVAEYAHERGIVHRDIKPDNVFLTRDGRVKLADFGIAHIAAEGTMTVAGTVLGTPGYMAPEQVRGEAVDERADLFAIGVVGYEMLTGVNPFTDGGAHATTVMYRVLQEDLPDVTAEVPGVPDHVGEVIAIATAKDADDRFDSASEMRAACSGDLEVRVPQTIVPPEVPGGPVDVGARLAPTVLDRTAVAQPQPTGRRGAGALAATAAVVIAIGAGPYLFVTAMQPSDPTVSPSAAASASVPADAPDGRAETMDPGLRAADPRVYLVAHCEALIAHRFADAYRTLPPAQQEAYGSAVAFEEQVAAYGISGYDIAEPDYDLGREHVSYLVTLETPQMPIAYTWRFVKTGDGDWYCESRKMGG